MILSIFYILKTFSEQPFDIKKGVLGDACKLQILNNSIARIHNVISDILKAYKEFDQRLGREEQLGVLQRKMELKEYIGYFLFLAKMPK